MSMKIYKGEAADFGAEAAEQYINAGEFDELFYMDEENIPKEIWREVFIYTLLCENILL